MFVSCLYPSFKTASATVGNLRGLTFDCRSIFSSRPDNRASKHRPICQSSYPHSCYCGGRRLCCSWHSLLLIQRGTVYTSNCFCAVLSQHLTLLHLLSPVWTVDVLHHVRHAMGTAVLSKLLVVLTTASCLVLLQAWQLILHTAPV